jgi:hypothetical protein
VGTDLSREKHTLIYVVSLVFLLVFITVFVIIVIAVVPWLVRGVF